MTRPELFLSVRLVALSTALVIPLLGCVFGPSGPEAPDMPRTCDASASWTPERIELLDMDDEIAIDEDPNVRVVTGGQGSSMVGFYVAVYGDDIPTCLGTTVSLSGEPQNGQWTFDSDGPRRAQTSNPTYWGWGVPGPETVSVTIGEMTVDYDIEIN